MRCPKFPDVDRISVVYEMERRVRSRATFSCKDPSQKVDGNNILICQRNGEWSAAFPQCIGVYFIKNFNFLVIIFNVVIYLASIIFSSIYTKDLVLYVTYLIKIKPCSNCRKWV